MSTSTRRLSSLPALALVLAALSALCVARPAAADSVYLVNGEVFEGVIAHVRGEAVEIRLPYGEIRLPRSRVARVERSGSTFEAYLSRRDALGRGASARQWLDLALWARAEGFEDGVREAALRAAALDPQLEGLPPLMRSLGFVLDQATGHWISEDEHMRRRGYVRVAGEWVSPEALEARARAAEAERQRRLEERKAAREDTLTQAITLLAASEVARAQAERQAPVYPVSPFGSSVVYPVAVFPGVVPQPMHPRHRPQDGGPPDASPPPAPPAPQAHRGGFDALAVRQPGSIIPLSQFETRATRHP